MATAKDMLNNFTNHSKHENFLETIDVINIPLCLHKGSAVENAREVAATFLEANTEVPSSDLNANSKLLFRDRMAQTLTLSSRLKTQM